MGNVHWNSLRNTFGPTHVNMATALHNLAKLYAARNKYAEAEPLHRRAVAIREKVFGPEHQDVARSLNNLASLYHEQWPPLLLPLRSMPSLGKFQAMSRPVFGRMIRRG